MKSFLRSILALPASRGAASEFRKTSVGGISPLAHYFLKHQPVRCAIITLLPLTLLAGAASANTVEVDPSNMNGWAFVSIDPTETPVNSGPYLGTAQMVNGPATPPLGSGSAHLATNPGEGDGEENLTTGNFDGTLLSAITSMSYSTYTVANNGSQFPFVRIAISTNGLPLAPNGSNFDTIFFEPPYQTPTPGNPSLLNEGAELLDTWQSWSATQSTAGGWWDNNGTANPGDGVEPLSFFVAEYPDATIVDPGDLRPGLDGVSFEVGQVSPGDAADGYIDDFTLGTEAGAITYDFNAPEPASLSLLGFGVAALLFRRRR